MLQRAATNFGRELVVKHDTYQPLHVVCSAEVGDRRENSVARTFAGELGVQRSQQARVLSGGIVPTESTDRQRLQLIGQVRALRSGTQKIPRAWITGSGKNLHAFPRYPGRVVGIRESDQRLNSGAVIESRQNAQRLGAYALNVVVIGGDLNQCRTDGIELLRIAA